MAWLASALCTVGSPESELPEGGRLCSCCCSLATCACRPATSSCSSMQVCLQQLLECEALCTEVGKCRLKVGAPAGAKRATQLLCLQLLELKLVSLRTALVSSSPRA